MITKPAKRLDTPIRGIDPAVHILVKDAVNHSNGRYPNLGAYYSEAAKEKLEREAKDVQKEK